MTTRTVIASAVLAFVAAGSAFAQEASSDEWRNVAGTQSRAQVQAELAQARADGSIKAYGAGTMPTLVSTASRADVLAAVMSARASGELGRIGAEAWGFDQPSSGAGTRLAQSVR